MKHTTVETDYSTYPLRPTGDELSEYEGWKDWSNAQWAWEFLRRNRDYQKLCCKVGSGSIDSKKCRIILRKHSGLLEYKHCWEPFGVNPPRFKTSKLFYLPWDGHNQINGRRRRKPQLQIGPGEVFIRFDVKAGASTARSLDGQISQARKILKKWETKWLDVIEKTAPKAMRGTYFYIPLLRLLDLVDHRASLPNDKWVTNTEIYRMLFPLTLKEQASDMDLQFIRMEKFDKKFQNARKRAVGYTKKRGYLDLDAMQERPHAATDWAPINK